MLLNVQMRASADGIFSTEAKRMPKLHFLSTMTMMRLMRQALFVVALAVAVQAYCDPDVCQHGVCYDGGCRCEQNYSGANCDIPFELCEDGEHTCFNGSTCVRSEHPDEFTEQYVYTYHCDCTKAIGKSAFAGLQCKQQATAYCILGRSESQYAFCTNGGTCIAKIVDGEAHPGCNCPDEYEGPHCQYLIGFAPDEERGQPHLLVGGAKGGAGGIVIFITVIAIGSVLMAVGYVIYLKKRRGAASTGNGPVGPLGGTGAATGNNGLTTLDLSAVNSQEVI